MDNAHIEASTAGLFAANQPHSFMPTAEAGWSVSGRAEARAKGRKDGSTCLVLSRNSVIVYIGQSDACTTKLASGTRTAL